MTVKRRFIKSDGTQALCRVKASRVRVNGEWAVQMIVTVPGMEKDDTFRFYEPAVREKSEPPEKLTERETEILKLIAEGYTVKEIAGKLNISARTVRTHKCNVMCKLQIHSTANLVRYAIENNLAGI
jgi:DNA-binding NarL/FixJ family response regulator